MGPKRLNKRRALDAARSHLEEVGKLHKKAFSVNNIPQSILNEENRTVTESRPLSLGDIEKDMAGEGVKACMRDDVKA